MSAPITQRRRAKVYAPPADCPGVSPPPVHEEIANSITHGVGLALSLVASVALLMSAAQEGDPWRLGGCAIYAATFMGVYLFSTLSHMFYHPGRRRLFRTLDQAFIYLFIVGTFTPFVTTYLRTAYGWTLLAAMWSVALFGFVSKVAFQHRVEGVTSWLYVGLGWATALAAPPLLGVVDSSALALMVLGGLCYTAGLIFWHFDSKVPFFHAVWHVAVLLGSALHFTAILYYVHVPA